MVRLYKVIRESLTEELSERQKRLLQGACNYHSLVNPGRKLQIKVYTGNDQQYPRLTDISTLSGQLVEDLAPTEIFEIQSTAYAGSTYDPHFVGDDLRLIRDQNVRHILLTPDDASDASVQAAWEASPKRKLYKILQRTSPVALDTAIELLTRVRITKAARVPVVRRDYQEEIARWRREPNLRFQNLVVAAEAKTDAQPAVIFGLHWLQTGGAERWAVEAIGLAKKAGLLPIVITDHDSQSPWIMRPELDGCLVLPLTFPTQNRIGDEPVLRGILENFDVRGVMLHHCQWLYDRLPWIKHSRPNLPVIDSLHILEYHGGGFPATAVNNDKYIDLHHVISPQLVTWLEQREGIDRKKVLLAPLTGLTAASAGNLKQRSGNNPFTVAFIGRLANQKRPTLFLELVRRLQKASVPIRAILHGDGELDPIIDLLIRRYGLRQNFEWRRSDIPVSKTLLETDLLVISSSNEGITLTTIEAIAAGVPVISTDVGSQRTLVPDTGLVPRAGWDFLRETYGRILQLAQDESARGQLFAEEKRRTEQFQSLESADDWMRGVFIKWAK
jgi:glycosyltransferase involved in cell wall biosynthesis